MRKTVSILLTLLYTVLIFAPLMPYVEYALHKEHIMLHYCENPDSDCEGICYVKKQVHNHQTDDALIVQHIFQVLFLPETTTQPFITGSDYIANRFANEKTLAGNPFKILQPPQG